MASLDRLCRWWTSATKEERFQLVKCAIEGDPSAPPLKVLQIAIYLAECEAGEVSQG